MITDYTAKNLSDIRERELTARLERRRQAAEIMNREHGGRLAAAAHLARAGRRSRSAVSGVAVAC